jgi:rhamnosyltransferase
MPSPADAMISIVLLCKNGADTLAACLDAIFAQQSPIPFEVIVIDSGSSDGSLEIARGYPLQLIEIPPSEFNYGVTKNYSLRFARGEYIVFISQDAIPADPNWLYELITPLLPDEKVAGVYSRQVEHGACNLFESYLLRTAYGQTAVVWDDYDNCSAMAFSNASSALRRSLLEREPFRKLPFAEDRVWAVEMLRQGYRIVYNPRSQVFHSHDFTVRHYYDRSVKNAITKRIVDGYIASPRPLLTRFLNPLGVARLLRRYIDQSDRVGLPRGAGPRTLLTFYLFSFAEFLGNVVGSRRSYRAYR